MQSHFLKNKAILTAQMACRRCIFTKLFFVEHLSDYFSTLKCQTWESWGAIYIVFEMFLHLDWKSLSFLPSSRRSLELSQSDYRVSRFLSLVGCPAVARVLVVLNFFHFRRTEVTEILGTFKTAECFYSLLQICAWTQPCLWTLEAVPGLVFLSAVSLFGDRVCLYKSELTRWC